MKIGNEVHAQEVMSSSFLFIGLLLGSVLFSGSAYAAESGDTIALVAADGMPIDKSTSFRYTFREVDVESGKFLDKSFTIAFGSTGSGEDELKRPQELETSIRFGSRAVKPGVYALVSSAVRSRNVNRRRHDTQCFSLGAMVYRFRKNHINVIPFSRSRNSNSFNRSDSKSDISLLLAEHPKMTAPAVVADVVGKITFEYGTNAVGRESCMAVETFDFTPFAR